MKLFKAIIYHFIKPVVYNRTIRLKNNKRDRIVRVKSAMAEMSRYSDIPLSW